MRRQRSSISVGESLRPECYRRHVAVGIDNSHASQRALEWAARQLYRAGDMFHLVVVLPEPDTLHSWPGVYIPPDEAEELEEFREATTLVRTVFAPICNDHGIPTDVHLIIAADNPDTVANILLDKVDDMAASVVVVASQGKRMLQELWSGSVTKRLVSRSHVPVVVYRDDLTPSGGSSRRSTASSG